MASQPRTYYDSIAQSDLQLIQEESELLANNKIVNDILEGFPELAVILDDNRQIIACNQKAVSTFGKNSRSEVIGTRFGEAISCIHRDEMGKNSCGTSRFCAECGAAHSIKFTREERKSSEEECRITSDLKDHNISFDFRVSSTPINISDKIFTLFSIKDISADKRRQTLERIFFHDVLNTASVINGLAELIDPTDDDFNELHTSLKESSKQLISEIEMQRDLRNAEDGNLYVKKQHVLANDIINSVYQQYANHKIAEGKKLKSVIKDNNAIIETDDKLLIRSFGNLVKNAIEASENGEEIKIWTVESGDIIKFKVSNHGFIPEKIQLQIFQRSFTTKKGKGRGIGTYSAKLLVSKYLNGKVYFESSKKSGTIFTIEIKTTIY